MELVENFGKHGALMNIKNHFMNNKNLKEFSWKN